MTSFSKIYKIVASIPKGKVATYQLVSQMAKIDNPRVVGFALHQNKTPKTVPCHRVVNKNGKLATGYAFGGLAAQRKKLQKEGVLFLDEETVDLSQSLIS